MAYEDNSVLAGLAQFQSSVQQLAQTRALSSAREQVDQIHQSTLDEDQKAQAFKQLGQQFAFAAAQSGMPIAQSKQIIDQVAPAAQFYQTPDQAILNAPTGGKVADRAQGLIDDRNSQRMAEIDSKSASALGMAQSRMEAQRLATLDKRRNGQIKATEASIGEFMRSPDVKPLLELRNASDTIFALQQAGLDENFTGFNIIKKGVARIAEGGGKITDKDYEIIQGAPDFVTNVTRYVQSAIKGKPLIADREVVLAAARVMYHAGERRLAEAAGNYAASKQGLYDTLPEGDLHNRLNARVGYGRSRGSADAALAGGGGVNKGAEAGAVQPAGASGSAAPATSIRSMIQYDK